MQKNDNMNKELLIRSSSNNVDFALLNDGKLIEFHKDNAIILKEFKGQEDDRDLLDLIPFLDRKYFFPFFRPEQIKLQSEFESQNKILIYICKNK